MSNPKKGSVQYISILQLQFIPTLQLQVLTDGTFRIFYYAFFEYLIVMTVLIVIDRLIEPNEVFSRQLRVMQTQVE